jgi:hypothetical protein
MASQWRRPLRNRLTEHVGHGASNRVVADTEPPPSMQEFAQSRLWTLVRTTLSSKMGMQLAAKKIDRDAYQMMRENMKTQLFRGYNLRCSGEGSMSEAFDEKLPLENEPFDVGAFDGKMWEDGGWEDIHPHEQSEFELPPHAIHDPRRTYNMDLLNDSYESEHALDHASGTWPDSQLSGIDHDARSLPGDRFMLEEKVGVSNSRPVDENEDEFNYGESEMRKYGKPDHFHSPGSAGMEYRGMAYSHWGANDLDTARHNMEDQHNTTSFSHVKNHPLDRLSTFP